MTHPTFSIQSLFSKGMTRLVRITDVNNTKIVWFEVRTSNPKGFKSWTFDDLSDAETKYWKIQDGNKS